MVLREEDALRVENTGPPHYVKIFVFNCIACGKEIRPRKNNLSTRSGYCVRCVKRKDHHPYQSLYNRMLASIRKTKTRFGRDIECTLTFEEFLEFTQIGCCHYCGGPIEWREYSRGPYNLDRKDNDLGYLKDNLVVCCFKCNNRKNSYYSYEEFRAISELLRVWDIANQHEKDEIMFSLISWHDKIEIVNEFEERVAP